MAVLFETIKWFFFLMTVIFGLLLLKGEAIFAATTVDTLKTLLLPWYLVFCGVIVGYMISLIIIDRSQDTPEDQSKKYARSFLIGSFVGVGLALISIFMI